MKKIFTLVTLLVAMVTGAWGSTETLTKSETDKTAVVGTSFTTSKNMITNGSSGDYVKLRTNMDTPQWTFTVNSGYKITGISVQAYSNNSKESATITMSTMCIDGGASILTGSDNTVFPVDKSNAITVNKSGFEATSSITCTFDNSNINSESGSKNAQLMAIITFTYETTGTPVTLSFSSPSASATIGSAFAEPTLTVSPVAAQSEVVYSSSNTGVATVNASTGVVTLVGGGSTTITAAISGSATYANASASYTLTVTDPTAASVKYSPASGTEFAAGAIDNIKNGDVTVATIKYSESGDGYVSFKFNKGGATYDEIEFNALTEGNGTNGNQPGGTFYTITPNYDGRIQMAVIINNDKIMVVEEDGVAMSGFTKKTEKFYGIESFDVKAGSTYKCYVSGSKMGFYGLVYTYSTAVDITPAYNKSTYVTTKALDFSGVDGLKAYVATAATNGSVTLDEVGAVPAGTPLMLIGTASTKYTVPVAASASAPAVNMLVAGDGTTTFDGTSYDYLLYTDGLFHQISSGSIAVGKAYLHCTTDPKAAVSRTLELNIGGGGATGIEKIKVGTEDNVYYDLQGRRVLYPTKGLYIVNGKKVILK